MNDSNQAAARLETVCVGLPRDVADPRRGAVRTGIWKAPVTGPVRVGRLNLAGDGQADLENHGGVDKAVYAYPAEHYPSWRAELGRPEHGPDALAHGGFGENLTLSGLPEDTVRIGERLRIGTAVLEVSQPRTPCFKLGLRFGDPRMVRRFLASGRSGFYLRVIAEGELAAGMPVERIAGSAEADALTVAAVNRLMHVDRDDLDGAAHAATLAALAEGWRAEFAARVAARRTGGAR